MSRLVALVAALLGAVLIAALAARPPGPLAVNADAVLFSADRAFVDIREMARAPHPTGSPEQARVRAYLVGRLRAVGLEARTETVPFSRKGRERLERWGGPAALGRDPENVVAVLPGRDHTGPAVLLMAHYDTVWGSPGAADDGAGVAAMLEIARALKAGPPPVRDVVLLFTDAEELNGDGALGFFERDPLAARIGVAVNLEARGAGGRAVMFETGPENGAMARLYARAVRQPTAQSLAAFIYKVRPNFTDFTLARQRGIGGVNFAFMGRAGLYHSPLATADAVEPGSVQHLGGQALDIVRALAMAPALPAKAPDAAFGDVLGLFLLAYPAWAGWIVLATAGALLALALVRLRAADGPTWREVGRGGLLALALVLHAGLALYAFDALSIAPTRNYYDRLAALPRLELQAALIGLAALVLAFSRWTIRARWAPLPAAVLLVAIAVHGKAFGFAIPVAVAAGGLAFLAVKKPVGTWAIWMGTALLVLLLALAAQVAAPTTTPLLAWPLLLTAAVAALAATLDPMLRKPPVLAVLAVAGAVSAAFVLGLAHLAFLGVGSELPMTMAAFLLLVSLAMAPLLRDAVPPRPAAVIALVLLLGAGGIALSVRLAPLSPTVAVYSR